MTKLAKRVVLSGLGLLLINLGQANLRLALASVDPPFVYWKDCNQPWLMGRAASSGVDPYRSLAELGTMFLPGSRLPDHPTPYPPFVVLLGLPLSLVSFEAMATAWLVVEILCLAAALFLLLRAVGAHLEPSSFMILLGVILVSPPVSEELRWGQFMSPLLLLLCLAWICLRQGRDLAAGFLLGGFIAIKVIAWPVVAFLALVGRWRAVLAATGLVLFLQVLTLPVLGISGLIDYYIHIAPRSAELWRPAEGNFTPWGWGDRLFAGFGFSFFVEPLASLPTAAAILTYAVPLALLISGLTLARRARHFDTGFAIATGLCILLSPIVWHFYLLLAGIPLAVLGRRLARRDWPPPSTAAAGLFLCLMFPGPNAYEAMARNLASSGGADAKTIPFGPGLLLLLPMLGFLGVLWLTWRSDRGSMSSATSFPAHGRTSPSSLPGATRSDAFFES